MVGLFDSSRFEPQLYVHGSKLRRKAAEDIRLSSVLEAYEQWRSSSLSIEGRKPEDIDQLVAALNIYKDRVEPILDSRPNSAQEVLQPSILEEFFEYLFAGLSPISGTSMVRKPESGYIGMTFNPKSLESLQTAPEFTIRRKDHDFIIGTSVALSVTASGSTKSRNEEVIVPAVAIECKRYLERNMLDECSGTAEKIKRATPYCLYIIVAEYLKMDDATPEMSLIDEIYVLRRQRNLERIREGFVPNPIYADLVVNLVEAVSAHLRKVWWDPTAALTIGKMFDRP